MDTKIDAIHRNHTWDLVPYPHSRSVIGVHWIFKTKYAADESVDKFKARLVAKGYAQRPDINYGETFAPHRPNGYHSYYYCYGCSLSLANLPNGCEIGIS